MSYDEWEKTVPETITGDSLWNMRAYRLALFLSDLAWLDVTKLMRDRRTISLSAQLYRALGSIGANLAEGYSRGTGKDRARFYEYALGSARESRDWYYKGRHILGEIVIQHRLELLTEVIRLLLTMVPQQRGRILREEDIPYRVGSDETPSEANGWGKKLGNLLQDVPLPNQ
ncbi:MAG: four helix bundle protein [Chloroflexi bacterium]|nr:four helix bundle protein [Chloroflexota bacterium]